MSDKKHPRIGQLVTLQPENGHDIWACFKDSYLNEFHSYVQRGTIMLVTDYKSRLNNEPTLECLLNGEVVWFLYPALNIYVPPTVT